MRILVVEDEPAIADAIRVALRDNGHAVDAVASATEALEWAAAAPYRLAILDIILGGMSGLDLCRALRKAGFHSPILMLTALGSIEDRVVGLDAGADDYLSKPFAIAELVARVRALSRRSPATTAPRIIVGELSLDPSTLGVWKAGHAVRLSAREYAFLELLARHPGQIFTQEHLLDALWDADAEIGSNIVEVYVRSLRRKLDGGRRDGLIETVRGAGYRLRAVDPPAERRVPGTTSRRSGVR
jgi:two-component system OmpR family response regulator